MMRGLAILVLIALLLNSISALCNETQININSASLEELDNLTGIGPAKAQAIIDTRPFSSVDDLLKVSGIGDATLSKIKSQGLACVNEDEVPSVPENNTEEENTTIINENNNLSEENSTEETSSHSSSSTKNSAITSNNIINNANEEREANLSPISLANSKDIKTENNNQDLVKNLPLYGIAAFCVLFGALFFLKSARRKKQNEFR